MNKPKISIITISYNSSKTIRRTIESILSQKYDNLDYIIVDGASTDGTMDIVNEYKDYFSHVISEKDKGISDAFNKGIEVAAGDIIGIINSDDYMLPGSLEIVAKSFDTSHDIFQHNILLENSLTGFRCREVPSSKFSCFPILCHIAHQGMFVTPSCYKTIGGYDLNIHLPMDLDFVIRASKAGMRFKYTNADVAVFRSGGSTDTSIFNKKKDYMYVIEKNSGSKFLAYLFYFYLVAIHITKKMLKVLGANYAQAIRYKEVK